MRNHDPYSDFRSLSAGCGTCLPGGCAVAAHSQGEWKRFVEGDQSLPRGRSPHLKDKNLWRESVRPLGVGALSAAR